MLGCRDVYGAAVIDSQVSGIDACIQSVRSELRVVEGDCAIACNAESARGMDGDGCVLHGDVAGYAYAIHRVSRDRDGKASRSMENDVPRGHDAYIVVEGDLVTSLECDG